MNYQLIKIPYSCSSDNVYEMMKAFIRDYIKELGKLVGTGPGTPKQWMIDALKMKYVWESPRDNKLPSDADIAVILGKSSESVRTAMRDYSFSGTKIMTDNFPFFGIAESDAMRKVNLAILEEMKPVVRFPILKENLGIRDDRTLTFLLDGLHYDISTQDKQLCINEDIFGKGAKSFAVRNLPKLIKYLKKDPVPYKFLSEVQPFMKEQGWGDLECRLMKSYMLADTDEFEWDLDDLGTEKVALKWPAIDSVEGGRVRILYEFNLANGADKAMQKKDLNAEYNRRAALYGIEPIDPNRSLTSPHAENIGNGCYRYCADKNEIAQVDISVELEKHIASLNGKILFDDAVTFVHGFNSTYTNSAVERFLRDAKCWQKKENGATYYFHSAFFPPKPKSTNHKTRCIPISPITQQRYDFALDQLKNAPGNTMSMKDLCEAMKPLYPAGAAVTNIYKLFNTLVENGLIEKVGSGKGGKYKLV